MAKPKQRGIWLTIWLSFMLISGIFAVISYLIIGVDSSVISSQFPSWVYSALGIISLLNLIFVIFLFFWKRWAFYSFLVSTIIVFGINLYAGVPIYIAIFGFIGIAVLYFSMRSRWKLFD